MVARRDRFDEFWSIYPKRSPHANPKKPAQDKWDQLVKTTDPDVIIAGARRLAAARAGQEPQHTPQARTWLNERRWQDDDGAEQPPEQRGSFTAPPLPEGAPRAMFVPWNRAHRDAWLAGKPGPTDWREIQVAS